MWTDAVDLRDFYATSLGRVAKRMIRRKIRLLWPDVTGMEMLGIGFATPLLNPFRNEASRIMAAMPAMQGATHWPDNGDGLTILTDELELPLADMSVDRVILVHALESADNVRPMMREVWRVMKGSARLLVIAPNRRGLWARFERTPFGHGQPYSAAQLSRLLRDTMFTPYQSSSALFVPPTRSRMILSSSSAIENIGERFFTTFAGVVVAEATKQIYEGVGQRSAKRRRNYLPLAQKTHGN